MGNYTNTINWLFGRERNFFGPQPGSLVPLNILAAFFSHQHSDASMRILHGYTSIGLIIGIFSAFSILVNIRSKFKKIRIFVPLLIINVWAFYTNTWVAINGMGIPYGRQFHVFLAVLIIFNFFIFRKYTNLKETSDLINK
jgi:ABC-type transport system involved in cytochrome c biogenesis permease subunit